MFLPARGAGVLEIREIRRLRDPEGPLWFRGYAEGLRSMTAQVNSFLDSMKLARIVVAHTPTAERRAVTRYGGRVVTIDTGMLASHMRAQRARNRRGFAKAIYPDGEAELDRPKPH